MIGEIVAFEFFELLFEAEDFGSNLLELGRRSGDHVAGIVGHVDQLHFFLIGADQGEGLIVSRLGVDLIEAGGGQSVGESGFLLDDWVVGGGVVIGLAVHVAHGRELLVVGGDGVFVAGLLLFEKIEVFGGVAVVNARLVGQVGLRDCVHEVGGLYGVALRRRRG